MPDLTRRSLLTLGGAAGLLALATPASAAPVAADLRRFTAPTGSIGTRGTFTALLGRTVIAAGAPGRHQLTLVEVADVDRVGAGSVRSFNLIFDQQDGAEFSEGIYRVAGGRWGGTPLLLTTIGPAGPHRRIQALINRG